MRPVLPTVGLVFVLLGACAPETTDDPIQTPAAQPESGGDETPVADDPLAEIRALMASEAQDDRLAAVHALAEIEGSEAVELLAASLDDIDFRIRRDAAGALGERGAAAEPAIEALGGLLDDEYGYVRERAVVALSRIGSDAAVDVVRAYARDVEIDYVDQAMEALGTLGDPRGIEEIEPYASHPDAYIRVSAHRALIRIGEPSAELLVELIGHSDPGVRCTAARSLGVVGTDTHETILRSLADTDPYPGVQSCALGGLGRMQPDEAVPRLALAAVAEQPIEVRSEAVASLGLVGTEAAVTEILRLLPAFHEPDGDGSNEAMAVLVGLGDRARAQVSAALPGAAEPTRSLLIETLANIGTPEDIPALEAARVEGNDALNGLIDSAVSSIVSRNDSPSIEN